MGHGSESNEDNTVGDPGTGMKWVDRILKFGKSHVEDLPQGKREGKSSFVKFVAVWIGLMIPISAGVLSRATEADTLAKAKQLTENDPYVAASVLGGVLAITFVGAGLVAHGQVNVSYGRCIVVGIKWGIGVLVLFSIAPVLRAFFDLTIRILSS